MKVNWINEKETLEKLIGEGVSYERIGREYSVTGAAVKKAAKKLGIKLEKKREINPNEHFNKGISKKEPYVCLNCGKQFIPIRNSFGKFCTIKCQGEYKHKELIKKWKNGEHNGLSGEYNLSKSIKKYLLEKH